MEAVAELQAMNEVLDRFLVRCVDSAACRRAAQRATSDRADAAGATASRRRCR